MDRFCQHCGKKLSDSELRCPECGMPVESAPYRPAYGAPTGKKTNVWIIVVVVIAVLGVVMIAFIPSLIPEKSSYTVTVTVEEFSIDVADKSQYGMVSLVNAELDITCGDTTKTLGPWKNCTIDGSVKSPGSSNKAVFKVDTTDLSSINYTMFLNIVRSYSGGEIRDTVDIYTVDTSKVTSEIPKAFGCSGVSFTVDNYSSSVMEFSGDTDPIGYVKLSFTAVKN